MVCKTVKPTLTETERENISYPSKCFYFTCVRKILYNTLFFKVLYLFVKIAQHKQDKKKEKRLLFSKYKKKQTNVTQPSELQKLYATCKEKIKTRLKLISTS